MEESNGLGSELESFRRQWLSEVRTKKGEQSAQPPPRNSVPSGLDCTGNIPGIPSPKEVRGASTLSRKE
ncbi:hypothetical protein J3459_016550 [Metarhizium acridum]|nr:hypothetical protein J3459_016550 [Metarhizium acridum]